MRKIFLYECKRLLWNKFFAGLVLVLLFYGWQVLRRVTILGVSHTAPLTTWRRTGAGERPLAAPPAPYRFPGGGKRLRRPSEDQRPERKGEPWNWN